MDVLTSSPINTNYSITLPLQSLRSPHDSKYSSALKAIIAVTNGKQDANAECSRALMFRSLRTIPQPPYARPANTIMSPCQQNMESLMQTAMRADGGAEQDRLNTHTTTSAESGYYLITM